MSAGRHVSFRSKDDLDLDAEVDFVVVGSGAGLPVTPPGATQPACAARVDRGD